MLVPEQFPALLGPSSRFMVILTYSEHLHRPFPKLIHYIRTTRIVFHLIFHYKKLSASEYNLSVQVRSVLVQSPLAPWYFISQYLGQDIDSP